MLYASAVLQSERSCPSFLLGVAQFRRLEASTGKPLKGSGAPKSIKGRSSLVLYERTVPAVKQ